MLTVGPSRTRAPLLFVSWASACPMRSTRAVFQVEASAMPEGKQAAVVPPAKVSPRAPLGPSETFKAGMPSRSITTVCHISAPASSETFSSSVSCSSRCSIRSVISKDSLLAAAPGRFCVHTMGRGGLARWLSQRPYGDLEHSWQPGGARACSLALAAPLRRFGTFLATRGRACSLALAAPLRRFGTFLATGGGLARWLSQRPYGDLEHSWQPGGRACSLALAAPLRRFHE